MNTLIVTLLVIFICLIALIIGGPIIMLMALAACIVIIIILKIFSSLAKELVNGLFNLKTNNKTTPSVSESESGYECSDCGKIVSQYDKFCSHCGESFTPQDES